MQMPGDRSGASVVQSGIECKRWLQRLPTVEEARPARCPCCGAASRPVGGALQLQGHGTRERQVRGPGDPDAPAATVVITARRYRCVPCGAVLVVVPREVQAGRLYSAAAIGFALALWGLVGASAVQVRQRICTAGIVGSTAAAGWATLRRWAQAVARGELFPSALRPPAGTRLRGVAATAAAALAALAEPATRSLPIERRAFLGAAHAA
jgi:hypothetical protein